MRRPPPRDVTPLRAEDDPEALRSAPRVRFFRAVMRQHLRRSFHAVRLARPGPPAASLPPDTAPDLPLIVYSNHPSWWDAAVLPAVLGIVWPARRFYAPIDDAALVRYGFMRRIGFFGVAQDSYAGTAAFLRIGARLLERPDTILGMTPEARFVDVRQRPLALRPGLAALIRHVPRVSVLPLAVDYTFWSERTPEALLRFGEPLVAGSALTDTLPGLQQALEARLEAAMDALAADAIARDPARFDTLLDGRAGVGGVYDAWRRLAARARGERFDPAHMPADASARAPVNVPVSAPASASAAARSTREPQR